MSALLRLRETGANPLDAARLDLLGWNVEAPLDGADPPERYDCIDRDVAGVRLLEHRLGRLTGRRPLQRAADRYLAIVYFISGGEVGLGGDGASVREQIRLEAGDVVAWHSDQGLGFEVPEQVHKLTFLIPEARLRGLFPSGMAAAGLHLKGQSGLGPFLSGYLANFADKLDATPPRWSSAVMDMTLEILARAMAAARAERSTSPGAMLMDSILAYIERNLEDCELCPAMIAGAHRISERYLHMLFANSQLRVSGWIRERRLARCAAALADIHQAVTVTEVAFRWGFKDSSHFSRLFKEHYGVAPAHYREQAAGRGPAVP